MVGELFDLVPLHVHPVPVQVLSGSPPPLSRATQLHRLTGDPELPICVSVSGCPSMLGPVMDWQPVKTALSLLPNDSWDILQHNRNPYEDKCSDNGWMNIYDYTCNKVRMYHRLSDYLFYTVC